MRNRNALRVLASVGLIGMLGCLLSSAGLLEWFIRHMCQDLVTRSRRSSET